MTARDNPQPMEIPPFHLERIQSLWEHQVDFNLSESGIHPLSLADVFEGPALTELTKSALGYSQTNGTPALRERIATLYPGATSEHILVTNGTSEANFVAIWSLMEPGDELVVMLPNYMQIYALGSVWRGDVKPLHLQAERGWSPDLDQLNRIVGPRTRAIAICNPNNPTGAILSHDARRSMVDAAASVGAWIVADEVYQGAEHEGEPTPSFWTEGYDRVLVTNGLSKAYGLPGLRVGWIVAQPETTARLWSYRDYTTIAPGTLSDLIAQHVLEPATRARILKRTRSILEVNYRIVSDWLRGHGEVFEVVTPRAGAIAFVRYHLPLDSVEFVERVRRERSVLLIPGSHFGFEGYFRIGYGNESEYLSAALTRVSDWISGAIPSFDAKSG